MKPGVNGPLMTYFMIDVLLFILIETCKAIMWEIGNNVED